MRKGRTRQLPCDRCRKDRPHDLAQWQRPATSPGGNDDLATDLDGAGEGVPLPQPAAGLADGPGQGRDGLGQAGDGTPAAGKHVPRLFLAPWWHPLRRSGTAEHHRAGRPAAPNDTARIGAHPLDSGGAFFTVEVGFYC
jgi:hypothetical protein